MKFVDDISKTGIKIMEILDEAEKNQIHNKYDAFNLENSSRVLLEMNSKKELKAQEKEAREIQLINMIQQVVVNTAYLPEMVGLIRKNNEVNEEMLELFQEMTSILKAQSKEEAEKIVLNVIEKAKNTNDALDAMTSLLNYGKILINLVFTDS